MERDPSLIPQFNVMLLGPTFGAVSQNWTELKILLRPLRESIEAQGQIVHVKEDEKKIYLPTLNGDFLIEVASADRPESLLGRGLDYVHITEADDIPDNVFYSYVLPMTHSPGRMGYMTVAGTPRRADSWFYTLFKQGGQDPDIESFQFTTFDNPLIDADEIYKDAEWMPDYLFRQEYLAETLEDVMAAFRNVDGCVSGEISPPEEGRGYVLGVDLGRAVDYTVIIPMDRERRRVMDMEHFNDPSWGVQKRKIRDAVEKWNNAPVVLDTANVGSAICQDLRESGVRVIEKNLHSPIEKEKIITPLTVALEKETVHFPQIPRLMAELKMYRRYSTNKQGDALKRASFSAPRGRHDDCVIALALALDGCPKQNKMVSFSGVYANLGR